jgi:hypothetical protein
MDNADPLMAANHKVPINKEYQVYVPSMELGLSQSLYRQRVCPFPLTKGGGTLTKCLDWFAYTLSDPALCTQGTSKLETVALS